MFVVPAFIPFTSPEAETVAIAVDWLLQIPPVVPFLRVVVFPTQTCLVPLIASGAFGSAFTVKDFVTTVEQPPDVTVYLAVTTPAVIPVTTPPLVMLALPDPEVVDQVPPLVPSVKAGVEEFTQTVVAPPRIAATIGSAFTVVAVDEVALFAVHPPAL